MNRPKRHTIRWSNRPLPGGAIKMTSSRLFVRNLRHTSGGLHKGAIRLVSYMPYSIVSRNHPHDRLRLPHRFFTRGGDVFDVSASAAKRKFNFDARQRSDAILAVKEGDGGPSLWMGRERHLRPAPSAPRVSSQRDETGNGRFWQWLYYTRTRFGERAFSIASLIVRNRLPDSLRSAGNTATFDRLLETHPS